MNSVRCESSKIEAAKHPTHSFQPGKLTSNTEVLQDLVLSSYSKDLIFLFFFSSGNSETNICPVFPVCYIPQDSDWLSCNESRVFQKNKLRVGMQHQRSRL